jgi:DeoR family ulaG and ulaABCDEF operon transcriptional repressor
MNEADRHRRIVDFLAGRPFATVKDLLDVLGVSSATIRRDIGKLHASGAVRKVFGGIAAIDALSGEARLSARPFEENRALGVEAKKAIAAEAEKLCRDGDAIIIHGGTTCHLFALRVARRNLKIYTNSMPVAAALAEHGTCHLTIAGGDLHREPGVIYTIGHDEPEFYGSKLFLSGQGIDAEGVMESHPLLVRAVQGLLNRADEVVLLADSRKFSIRARHIAFSLSRISTLVTDDGLADHDARMLEDAGVRLVIATVPKDGG